MNIIYERRENNYSTVDKFDSTKNNILLLGKADTYTERSVIINPMGEKNAKELYGANSDLYNAYVQCISVTEEYNVFTVNCRTYSDFLNTIESVLHYNFSYVVPLGIKIEDTFYNESSNKYEYYIDYFMYLIEDYQCNTTIVMTSSHADDFYDMDDFLDYNNTILRQYYAATLKDNNNYMLYQKNGSDIIFVLNNLKEVQYANVILAGQLSIEDYSTYPKNVNFDTYYDIDSTDIKNTSWAYHKYNYLTEDSSIENLVNMRLYEDVYKNALIDTMIKSVLRILDFDKYRGRLYNAYIKLQIQNNAKVILDKMKGQYFKNYKIKNIGFVKTEETAGYIYIELEIMPYGFMEYINVVTEV